MEIQQQILILLMFIFLVSLEQIIIDFEQSSLLRRSLKNLSSQTMDKSSQIIDKSSQTMDKHSQTMYESSQMMDKLTSVIKNKECNSLLRKPIGTNIIKYDDEIKKQLVDLMDNYFNLREKCMQNNDIKFKLSEIDSIISNIYSQIRILVLKMLKNILIIIIKKK
jgi:hypothetical protein